MKPSLIDTDILSAFLRGNPNVIKNADLYLQTYESLNVSIITYYEILNGLLYKDAKATANLYSICPSKQSIPINNACCRNSCRSLC